MIHGGSPVALERLPIEGPGLRPRIAKPSSGASNAGVTPRARGGFGLGLAIGRELAERMGGELSLDPSYGPGAKFTLKLPAARAPQEQPLAVG